MGSRGSASFQPGPAACSRLTAFLQPVSTAQCHPAEHGLPGGHHHPPGGAGQFPVTWALTDVPVGLSAYPGCWTPSRVPCPSSKGLLPPSLFLLAGCHPPSLAPVEQTGGKTPRPESHQSGSGREGVGHAFGGSKEVGSMSHSPVPGEKRGQGVGTLGK